MENCKKYERQYFMPPKFEYDWVKKDYVDAPPIWCSVDLRDGNQALIKERMAALVTDAMRAEYLKREGYDTPQEGGI